MSATVIQLSEWVRVEIDGGVVTGGSVPAHVGRLRYFVDVVEHDGRQMSMWDGSDYDEACDVAADLAKDFGVAVHDKLRGRAN